MPFIWERYNKKGLIFSVVSSSWSIKRIPMWKSQEVLWCEFQSVLLLLLLLLLQYCFVTYMVPSSSVRLMVPKLSLLQLWPRCDEVLSHGHVWVELLSSDWESSGGRRAWAVLGANGSCLQDKWSKLGRALQKECARTCSLYVCVCVWEYGRKLVRSAQLYLSVLASFRIEQ